MTFPLVTAVYAAVLALIFFALSVWVSAGRGRFKVNHGDGGNAALQRRIRAHANFAEYVPLILILVAFLESSGASRFTAHLLLLPLTLARLAHPVGMLAPENSAQQLAFRGAGAGVTWLILVAAAVLLLVRLA